MKGGTWLSFLGRAEPQHGVQRTNIQQAAPAPEQPAPEQPAPELQHGVQRTNIQPAPGRRRGRRGRRRRRPRPPPARSPSPPREPPDEHILLPLCPNCNTNTNVIFLAGQTGYYCCLNDNCHGFLFALNRTVISGEPQKFVNRALFNSFRDSDTPGVLDSRSDADSDD